MLRFILNERTVETDLPSGSTVLDFIRYRNHLPGTKIGCREGDCGACTILVGTLSEGAVHYRSMTSCLMPLGNANGKHIVTVEGINMETLSPVQRALAECNGTQCGFCTPGFVMSLTAFVLAPASEDPDAAIKAIDGNICRCTGYKSIERAAAAITQQVSGAPSTDRIGWLVANKFIPEYFGKIAGLLSSMQDKETAVTPVMNGMMIGGGTDLVVQKHQAVKRSALEHVFEHPLMKGIGMENGRCRIGASVTVTEMLESPLVNKLVPGLPGYLKLVSSTPIRNMATLAGNLVNASPIGDMTVFLLALDGSVLLNKADVRRELKLRDFYLDYKKLNKEPDEWIEAIYVGPMEVNGQFHFEKVSKRTHLDIASVNSACMLETDASGMIRNIHLSAGGVAPYPKYLERTGTFLKGKKISEGVLEEAIGILQSEVAPISDARGTKEYKRLLLRQLFLSHMLKLANASKPVKSILLV